MSMPCSGYAVYGGKQRDCKKHFNTMGSMFWTHSLFAALCTKMSVGTCWLPATGSSATMRGPQLSGWLRSLSAVPV